MRLRSENARYNIGDIVRTINTPRRTSARRLATRPVCFAPPPTGGPETGRVMMTEMIAESRRVKAAVTVSFQSQPLLGLLPPIEMHEHYRASGKSQTIVEASATYGPFRRIE